MPAGPGGPGRGGGLVAAIVASLSLHIVTLYLLALVAQGRSPWQAVQIAQTDQGAGRHSRRLLEVDLKGPTRHLLQIPDELVTFDTAKGVIMFHAPVAVTPVQAFVEAAGGTFNPAVEPLLVGPGDSTGPVTIEAPTEINIQHWQTDTDAIANALTIRAITAEDGVTRTGGAIIAYGNDQSGVGNTAVYISTEGADALAAAGPGASTFKGPATFNAPTTIDLSAWETGTSTGVVDALTVNAILPEAGLDRSGSAIAAYGNNQTGLNNTAVYISGVREGGDEDTGVGDALHIVGASVLSATTIVGPADLQDELMVAGTSSLAGAVTADAGVQVTAGGANITGATTVTRSEAGPALTIDAAAGSLALRTASPINVDAAVTAASLEVTGTTTLKGAVDIAAPTTIDISTWQNGTGTGVVDALTVLSILPEAGLDRRGSAIAAYGNNQTGLNNTAVYVSGVREGGDEDTGVGDALYVVGASVLSATTIVGPVDLQDELKVAGTSSLAGAVTADDGIKVAGPTVLNGATSINRTDAGRALTIAAANGSLALQTANPINVDASVTADSLEVAGTTALKGAVTITAATSITVPNQANTTALTLTGGISTNTTDTRGALQVTGDVDLTSAFTVLGDSSQTGNNQFNGTVTITGLLTAQAGLAVTGATVLKGALTVNRTDAGPALTIAAANGSLALQTANPINVDASVTADSLEVTGTTALKGAVTITAATSITVPNQANTTALTLTGGISTNTTDTRGALQVTGDVDLTSAFTVLGDSSQTGNNQFNGTVTITGLLTAQAGLAVTGATVLKGALTVNRTDAGPALTIQAAAGSLALQTANPINVDAAATVDSLEVTGTSTLKAVTSTGLNVTGPTTLNGATAVTRTEAGPALTIDAANGSLALQTADAINVDASVTAGSLDVKGKTTLRDKVSITGPTSISVADPAVFALTLQGGAAGTGGAATAQGSTRGALLVTSGNVNLLAAGTTELSNVALAGAQTFEAVTVTGRLTVQDGLEVAGPTTLNGATTITRTDPGTALTIDAAEGLALLTEDPVTTGLQTSSNLVVSNTLDVTGTTALRAAVTITAPTIISVNDAVNQVALTLRAGAAASTRKPALATTAQATTTGGALLVSAGDVNLKARLDVTGTTALKGATAITRTTAGPALTIDAAAGSAALQTADPVVVDAAVTANSLKVNRNTTLSGGAAITGATTITGSAVITGPTTLTALDGQVALTIKGDNAVPVTTALVVDGNVQVGANSNGLRRNLVVTGESSFGSGLPGTPVAVKTWGGLLVNGHLQAGTSDIKGDSIVEGHLDVWRSITSRTRGGRRWWNDNGWRQQPNRGHHSSVASAGASSASASSAGAVAATATNATAA